MTAAAPIPSVSGDSIAAAVRFVSSAKYVLITAGAGMSVDSGLPDFRGPEGFWRAYPLFRTLGKRFEEMSNPRWFATNPRLAWGFFGHRLQLYRATAPHQGYHILRSWQEEAAGAKRLFVFTSNVDGAFEKAGFAPEQIVECHGAGTRLQCTDWRCTAKHGPYATPADLKIDVDMSNIEAPEAQMPRCPHCNSLARPNILMFDDSTCDMRIVDQQDEQYEAFKELVLRNTTPGDGQAVVLEFGAGTFVTTIRRTSEAFATSLGARLVRINLREPEVPEEIEAVGLAMGALPAIQALDSGLRQNLQQPSA